MPLRVWVWGVFYYFFISAYFFLFINTIFATSSIQLQEHIHTTLTHKDSIAHSKVLSKAEKYFPLLVDTIKETLGEEGAIKFFQNWELEDFLIFLIKIYQYLPKNGDHKMHTNSVYGILGEVLGAIKIKKHQGLNLSDIPSNAIFISDLQLDLPDKIAGIHVPQKLQSRHDGMIFTVDKKGKLTIYVVFESKMGGGYIEDQGQNVLKRWQKYGILINDSHFEPDRIFIKVRAKNNHHYEYKNIRNVSFSEFKTITIVTEATDNSLNTDQQWGEPLHISIYDFLQTKNTASSNMDSKQIFHQIAQNLAIKLSSHNGETTSILHHNIEQVIFDMITNMAQQYAAENNVDQKTAFEVLLALCREQNISNTPLKHIPYVLMMQFFSQHYPSSKIQLFMKNHILSLTKDCPNIFYFIPKATANAIHSYQTASSF